MEALCQAYLDNLAAACVLVKPQVTPDMSEDQIIETIRGCAGQLHQLHQENDKILDKILFSKSAETLTAEEAEQLSALAGKLFSFNRSPDTGIAYRIHKLLYAYAQYHQDRDLIVRELYSQGITLLYLNIRDPELGINLFIDQIGACFRAGAAYLDQYTEITCPETRSYIIRCLGNVKYGLESFQGGNSGEKNYDISASWDEYMECFTQTMRIVESPRYREMDPEIPWDSFVYTMHYDRTQFLSALRDAHDPGIAQAVLESAAYVYHHQEQIAKVKGRAIGVRTQYVYNAARYHAGLLSVQELMEVLFGMCESAGLHDFSGDNIWTILYTPEYLMAYAKRLPPEESEALQDRLQQAFDKQKEFLFLLPRNEYALQVSKTMHAVSRYVSAQDKRLNEQLLEYILACHAPTFVHSKVVALVTRRFCQRMAETRPELLNGLLHMDDPAASPESLDRLLDFAFHCGLYHDLGKCMLLSVVGQYSRRLLDEEFACIKLHTVFGCDLLETLDMAEISCAAYYHHRAYDGQGGYPRAAGKCPASVRQIVDIITVVDALDAGTDNIGRSYAAAKTYSQLVDELRAGKGSRYAPEVVELLDDPSFCREMGEFLIKSRRQVYIDAYCSNNEKNQPRP